MKCQGRYPLVAGSTCMAIILFVVLKNTGVSQVKTVTGAIKNIRTYVSSTQQHGNRTLGNDTRHEDLEETEKDPEFQPVSDLDLGSLRYLYTALWQGDNVRIIAIKVRGQLNNIVCVLSYSSDLKSNLTRVKASVKDLPDYGKKHTMAYIKCPVEKERKRQVPRYIGLVKESKPSVRPKLFLPVELRNFDPNKTDKYPLAGRSERNGPGLVKGVDGHRVVQFTVCVPGMFNYSNAAQLVEKLEMMRLLGAGRVVLYEISVGDNVHAVLRHYMQEWSSGRDTLQVIRRPWKFPQLDVHYHGQMGAIDDCLYRYGWLSHYMIFDDLDEVIFSFRHDNWSQFVAEKEKNNPDAAAFMFLSSVTNKDHLTPAKGFKKEALRYQSSILAFTKRDDHFYRPNDKSKLILKPKKVQVMNVHLVVEATGPTEEISQKEGMVYHFRWPKRKCKPEVDDTRLVEKFGKRLAVRLKAVWSNLKGVDLGSKFPKDGASKATCEK